jgi:two-component system phosphate regulon response regulator PhoB
LIVSQQAPLPYLEQTLIGAGYAVYAAQDSAEAVPLAQRMAPAVVLMGKQQPGTDALEVCRKIGFELRDDHLPFFLLAPDELAEVETGDGVGGSTDHVKVRRLTQGILSLLEGHVSQPRRGEVLKHGVLRIDRRRHQVTLHDRPLPLTLTEFRIIWALAERPGFVVTRRQLTDACRRDDNPVQERTVDVHIKSIRRKLKSDARLIETVRGVGYRLCDLPSDT